MERTTHSVEVEAEGAPPGERLPTYLRGYAHQPPRNQTSDKENRRSPGPWTLIFDTETTSDASQRLRIGSYQLLKGRELKQAGLFFSPDALEEEEVACLRREARRSGQSLLNLDEFVETIVFEAIYDTGGTIVGFNLPFDLSRLARSHESARKSMKGGFSFKLSRKASRPNLRIKHLSRRMAFINFAGPGKQETARSGRQRGQTTPVESGTFLDLATLAAALTGSSHTLASLATLLDTRHRKTEGGDFGRPIDAELIAYAVNDTQVTRECWDLLLERYKVHEEAGRPAHAVYSEASLGKAYLEAMGIRPWREVQPDVDPSIVGAVMSAYYGGRAEVHRRREVIRTIYCDFASMYPTVCTLMGLWRFVIGSGLQKEDATDETRAFLDAVSADRLGDPGCWPALTVLCEVEPEADIFPVRAKYGDEPVATIGVNYLSSARPLWFTLADCIASKLLTGKAPRLRKAWKFSPLRPQTGLRPVALAGDVANRVDPNADDLYRRVIDLRRTVRKRQKVEKDQNERDRLEAQQLALKILANATSYGIFIELNVDALTKPEHVALFEGERHRDVTTETREAPGRFFNPLLATLITGAARLLLAIAERKLLDAGLDWAFCDTDSMAFAKPAELDAATFEQRVRAICDWFAPLDPFENKGDVLEIEGQNFETDPARVGIIKPLYCYAISAKRYALFNLDDAGGPIIRKASGHGLGHLLPPYTDGERKRADTGVPAWQEDFWGEIVKAGLAKTPDAVRLDWHPAMIAPAASQYTATSPVQLRPFNDYNRARLPSERVAPFNFMLWFHSLRPEEVVLQGRDIAWSKRQPSPKPAAPYDRDPSRAAKSAFDRTTGEPVGLEWLKTYARALRTYARHPETKFLASEQGGSGVLRRRHVVAGMPTYIGKEADRWEEDEEFGANDATVIEYETSADQRDYVAEQVRKTLLHTSISKFARAARVSEHTISAVARGEKSLDGPTTRRILQAAVQLDAANASLLNEQNDTLAWLRAMADRIGVKDTSAMISVDPANLRKMLTGERGVPEAVVHRVRKLRGGDALDGVDV